QKFEETTIPLGKQMCEDPPRLPSTRWHLPEELESSKLKKVPDWNVYLGLYTLRDGSGFFVYSFYYFARPNRAAFFGPYLVLSKCESAYREYLECLTPEMKVTQKTGLT